MQKKRQHQFSRPTMLSKSLIVLLFPLFMMSSGFQKKPVSTADRYFKQKLLKKKLANTFEEDSEYGYIKIGNFLNAATKNAIVISFDTLTTFTVYELQHGKWQKTFSQPAEFSRINGLKAYIEDYNFDGVKDIGIKNEVSNGTAIMTFHLWLSTNKSYQYIPEFEDIGNPVLLTQKKIIKGFEACCVFTEITITDYRWHNNKLIKTQELEIDNYPYGIKAILKNVNKKSEHKIKMTQKNITKIIDKYSDGLHWKLIDNGK